MTSRYEAIAARIASDIESGLLAPGERLPSLRNLCETAQVSLMTALAAYRRLEALQLVEALPRSRSGNIVANQLGRCATSVGANYRSACKARSRAEFISKVGVVEEEADESGFWMEVVMEGGLLKPARVRSLHAESLELVAIMAASRTTASRRARSNRQSAIGNRK